MVGCSQLFNPLIGFWILANPSISMYYPSPCSFLSLPIVRRLTAKEEVWMTLKNYSILSVLLIRYYISDLQTEQITGVTCVKNLASFTSKCQDWSAGLEPHEKKYEVHETTFMILMIFWFIGEFRLDALVIETLHTTSEPSQFLYKRP